LNTTKKKRRNSAGESSDKGSWKINAENGLSSDAVILRRKPRD